MRSLASLKRELPQNEKGGQKLVPRQDVKMTAAPFLFLTALLIALVASAAFAADAGRFTVVDSGHEGESLVSDTVAWIDDDRILFTGFGPLSGPRLPDRYDNKALYVWNVRSGEIKNYAALGRSSGFCLASGVKKRQRKGVKKRGQVLKYQFSL